MTDDVSDPVDQLKTSKELDADAFEERVRDEARIVEARIADGTFDNDQVTVGLEYEFYAVDEGSAHIPRPASAPAHARGRQGTRPPQRGTERERPAVQSRGHRSDREGGGSEALGVARSGGRRRHPVRERRDVDDRPRVQHR